MPIANLIVWSRTTPKSTGRRKHSRNSVAPKRSERPKFRRRPSISDYSARELDEIASWVQSDGLLRTDDDLLVEIRKEMGFKRGGSRIDPAIRDAIRRTKGT